MEQCRASSSLSSSFDPSNTRRPHAQFTRTMTEPHHALTVDGEGEGSGGNEVHEIYVRLGAAPATALNEKDTSPCQNEIKDTTPCKSFRAKTRSRTQLRAKNSSSEKGIRGHNFVHKMQKATIPCHGSGSESERTQFRVEPLKRTQLRVYLKVLFCKLARMR